MTTATKTQLNKYSSRITQPASQGASQAMLIATGLSWSDLNKPQVGIGAVWYDGNPCNMHLADLGNHVKTGVEQAGMVAMRFNTKATDDFAVQEGTQDLLMATSKHVLTLPIAALRTNQNDFLADSYRADF